MIHPSGANLGKHTLFSHYNHMLTLTQGSSEGDSILVIRRQRDKCERGKNFQPDKFSLSRILHQIFSPAFDIRPVLRVIPVGGLNQIIREFGILSQQGVSTVTGSHQIQRGGRQLTLMEPPATVGIRQAGITGTGLLRVFGFSVHTALL